MTRPAPAELLDRRDRALGEAVRTRVGAHDGLLRVLETAAQTMSPAFRILVAVLILWPPTRRRGLRALIAGSLAALLARWLRDAIDRPRPGGRGEGGLPSRHAAASVAIASVLADDRPTLVGPLALITAAGLLGRVSTGDHDPADLLAGAILGRVAARAVIRTERRITRP